MNTCINMIENWLKILSVGFENIAINHVCITSKALLHSHHVVCLIDKAVCNNLSNGECDVLV